MRKLYVLFWFLFSVLGFSQYITVTPSTDANDLVNNVLLHSSCNVSGVNPQMSTGSDFGSTNGIGTFTNSNTAFPMTSGVILSTGNVLNAPGPNSSDLNDGSLGWLGDTALANEIGGGATFLNASVLEFDFTPISPQFSFDFIFASEEYGTYQCNIFPDAFAFLLTNTTTGVTTNLAVIPSTNIPISVENIRNSVFNTTCPSANPSFFGNYYGNNAVNSPTNYNGETILMTAAALLVPGNNYHIKLVIADRGDNQTDSAVFISGTSFNIGQSPLGADLTRNTNTAVCFGEQYTIQSGLNPTNYNITWSGGGTPTPNGAGLIVTTSGIYQMSYSQIGSTCPPLIDTIVVEYYDEILTVAPIDIYKCNTGAATYSYNIAQNTPILMAGAPPLPANTTIAYFTDSNLTIPISSPYTAAPNTTVYVKITDAKGCYTKKQFDLKVADAAVMPSPAIPDITNCQDASGTNLVTTIYLNTKTNQALAGQPLPTSVYDVSYYNSSANATIGTSASLSATTAIAFADNTTIWVRIQNTTDPNSCFVITSFVIHVIARPEIDDTPKDILICDNDSYILPALATGEQYWTSANGPNGTGTQLFAGSVISLVITEPNPVVIHIYEANGTCIAQDNFKITFLDLDLIPDPILKSCDSYTLPTTDFGHYYTTSQLGLPPQPGEHLGFITTPITTSQTVYFYVNTYVNPPLVPAQLYCEKEKAFSIVIEESPIVAPFANVFKCKTETYTLPFFNTIPNVVTPVTSSINYYDSPNGPNGSGVIVPQGTVMSASGSTPFSQNFWVWASNGTIPCTDGSQVFRVQIGLPVYSDQAECTSYKLPDIVPGLGNYYKLSGGPNVVGQVQYANGTVLTKSQNVYVYAVSDSGCFEEKMFKITIYLPEITALSPVYKCLNENYTLPPLQTFANNTDVTPMQVYPTLFYNTAPDGSGTTKNVGDPITTSQIIYVVAYNSTSGCPAISVPLNITIYPLPIITIANPVKNCFPFTLVADATDVYYYGPNKTGGLVPIGTTFSTDDFIYAHSTSVNGCEVDIKIDILIYNTIAIQYPDQSVCTSYTLPAIVQPAGEFNKYYSAPGGNAADEIIAPTLITSTQTIYVHNRKSTRFPCDDEKSFTITIIKEPVAYPVPTLNTTFCDDTDGNNDGNIALNLSATFDAQILNPIIPPSPPNPQVGSQFVVSYFATQADAIANSNAITNPTTIKNLYVRVTNTLAPMCYDVQPLTITVNKKPIPTNPISGLICTDNVTGLIIQPFTIDSGLTAPTYSFEWRKDGNSTIISTASSLPNVILEGVYELIVTNVATGCKETSSTTIIKSQTAISTFSLSENFDNSQFVTISAVGNGDYVYQLDSNPEQDSPVFTDVPYGSHLVTVRDRHGCQSGTVTVLVINYPKFFTPNGDGNNDTWNVIGLDNDLTSNIYIYDRFGKYIAQIKPSEKKGWDGTYNGIPLPSSDYWFSATYTEKGEDKIFKAHFTMKR